MLRKNEPQRHGDTEKQRFEALFGRSPLKSVQSPNTEITKQKPDHTNYNLENQVTRRRHVFYRPTMYFFTNVLPESCDEEKYSRA